MTRVTLAKCIDYPIPDPPLPLKVGDIEKNETLSTYQP